MTHGLPHIGAYYANAEVDSHRLLEGALCACCGTVATDAHHEPPRGMSGGNSYRELGGVRIRPALIALCRRCHTARHNGKLKIRWIWNDAEIEGEWISGLSLSQGCIPHDDILKFLGHWDFSKI